MSLACWQLTITDDAGNIKPGAIVRVVNSLDQTLATLKPARDGTGSLGNPFPADAEGFARFFVPQGLYDVRVTFAGNQRDHVWLPLFEDTSLAFALPVYQLATPAAGTTENYAPPGFTDATTFLDLDLGAGDAIIGGLVGMTDGQRITIRNKHVSNSLTLKAESTGSTAANRFSIPFDVTVLPGASVTGIYVGAILRFVL